MPLLMRQSMNSIYQRISGIFFGKIAHASIWLFVGGVGGGILSYVFQVLMGRMLGILEYGLFTAMMAIFTVLSAPLGALMMVISRKVSEYSAKKDSGSITHFYYSINIFTAVIGIFFLAAYIYFAPDIKTYLKAADYLPVYLLGVLIFLNLLPIINNSFLQGMQRFIWLSASSALSILFKIVFSVALVWLGYGVSGAIGGTVLAMLAGWIITYGALHFQLGRGRGLPSQASHLSFIPMLPVFLANVAFATMTQLDIVLVNFFFPAQEAGLYAAASVLGKAVLYLPGGIVLALYPMVTENHVHGESSKHLLKQALGLVFVLCGIGATFYFFFGEWLVRLLYGETYQVAGEILRYYGFAILPMTFVMVMEYFLIAKGRVIFAYLFVILAPLQILTTYWFHDSLLLVVGIMACYGILLALMGSIVLVREFRK